MRVEEFIAKSRTFIEEERRVEQEEFFFMYQKYEAAELESLGLAVRDIQITKVKSAFFKRAILVLQKKDGSPFPRNMKIKMNDSVIIAERRGREQEGVKALFQGVVYRLRADSVHVLTEEKATNLGPTTLGAGSCLLKSGDNITFERRANQDVGVPKADGEVRNDLEHAELQARRAPPRPGQVLQQRLQPTGCPAGAL